MKTQDIITKNPPKYSFVFLSLRGIEKFNERGKQGSDKREALKLPTFTFAELPRSRVAEVDGRPGFRFLGRRKIEASRRFWALKFCNRDRCL
jgi:hypothetical protein